MGVMFFNASHCVILTKLNSDSEWSRSLPGSLAQPLLRESTYFSYSKPKIMVFSLFNIVWIICPIYVLYPFEELPAEHTNGFSADTAPSSLSYICFIYIERVLSNFTVIVFSQQKTSHGLLRDLSFIFFTLTSM